MLYNRIVQSGTVREKLPLVQSLSVVGGGALGENAKTLHFASCTLQPGPFSDIP